MRLRDLGFQNSRPTLKKFNTLRRKITQKRDLETYHKCFWDFEIGPKFSENPLIIEERFYTPSSCATLPYLCMSGLSSPRTPFTRALHNTRQNISFSGFIRKYILYKNKLIIMTINHLCKAKVDSNTSSATWKGSLRLNQLNPSAQWKCGGFQVTHQDIKEELSKAHANGQHANLGSSCNTPGNCIPPNDPSTCTSRISDSYKFPKRCII